MILQLAPDAPLAVRLAADAALALHIGGGLVGIGAGAVVLAAPKGGRVHRLAGDVFVVGMLVMAAVGAAVAPLIGQPSNLLAAVFVAYLVITGWQTMRPAPARWLELAALPLAAAIVAGGVALALVGMREPHGVIGGAPYQAGFVFAALAALATAGDLRAILGGALRGAGRLARHLWRMNVALLIAASSLFLGQPKVFPPPLRGSPILLAPELWVLAVLVWWLARLALGGRPKPRAVRPLASRAQPTGA